MGIHESAVVSASAEIDSSAEIGPGVVIEGDVKIGANVKIMPYANIFDGTEIGEGTIIHNGAVIGNVPQDYSFKGERSFTKIGKNTIIREYVTIHRGAGEGTSTVVGDNNFIMVQVHLGHNCKLENNVIIAVGALLSGHVEVGEGTFISGGVVFHQFCRIGRNVMVGGFTGVNKDVPPYMLVEGSPTRPRCVNVVALKRNNFPQESIRALSEAHRLLFRSRVGVENAIEILKSNGSLMPEVQHLISFISNQMEGRHGRGRGTRSPFQRMAPRPRSERHRSPLRPRRSGGHPRCGTGTAEFGRWLRRRR